MVLRTLTIRWTELSPREFRGHSFSSFSKAVRTNELCTGFISRMPEFGWTVFNIFPPLGRVFNHVRLVSDIELAASAWLRSLQKTVSGPFDSSLRAMRIGKNAPALRFFFGNFPLGMGKTYGAKATGDEVFLSVQRHIGFTVPMVSTEAVMRNFDEQLVSYGPLSFLPCDEGRVLRYDRDIGRPGEPGWAARSAFSWMPGSDHFRQLTGYSYERLASTILANIANLVADVDSGRDVYSQMILSDIVRPPLALYPIFSQELSKDMLLVLNARCAMMERLLWPTFHSRVTETLWSHEGNLKIFEGRRPVIPTENQILVDRLRSVKRRLESAYPVLAFNPFAKTDYVKP